MRKLLRKLPAAFLGPIFALISLAPASAQWDPPFYTKSVVDVAVRPGVTVRYLAITSIFGPPSKAVILFAGGNGLLNIDASGAITTDLQHNFLVRSRFKFANHGLYVAIVDTAGAMTINGMDRLSKWYAADIAKVIIDVRLRSGQPVWLVGTSSGTLSAASVAARRPLVDAPTTKVNFSRPDGIVLISTQAKLVDNFCEKIVFDAALANINVPAFTVAHVDDDCACSPPKGRLLVLTKLTNSLVKESQLFMGGLPQVSRHACDALTPHGFYGIESSVVSAIANWVKTH
jgi:hypothetical protein